MDGNGNRDARKPGLRQLPGLGIHRRCIPSPPVSDVGRVPLVQVARANGGEALGYSRNQARDQLALRVRGRVEFGRVKQATETNWTPSPAGVRKLDSIGGGSRDLP
jgi:hypothetical protein